MPLFSTGVNHTTADADVRERLAFNPDRLAEAVSELRHAAPVDEAVIVSTCNRTELYCLTSSATSDPVIDWLSRYHGMAREQLNQYLYSYEGRAAVHHLMRVVSGLDSMVLGEPQILGQTKEAFQLAQRTDSTGVVLSRMFQHAFAVAKRVRTETRIGASPVSVASAAVGLARQIFADFSRHTALLIGAGETVGLVARYLHQQKLGTMIIANRTVDRAREVAREFQGYAISLDEMPAHLDEADVIVSSTASPGPVLRAADMAAALKRRRRRPVFILDIAIPRDVDPEVGELEDVYLYDVDDLRHVIQANEASRQEAARHAEVIIDEEVEDFLGWVRAQDAVQVIREVRDRADHLRGETLTKARRRLNRGEPPGEVLEFLARNLTNKLLHMPSTRLRDAGYRDDQSMIRAARHLYGLDDEED